MSPLDEETIESPREEPAPDHGPRPRSARRFVGIVLVAGLTLGAGVAVGAATRNSSSTSGGASTSSGTGGASSTSPSALGDSSGGLDTAAIAAKASPAIVDIDTKLANGGGAAAGTGMIISATGIVLTNNHVIDNAASITVQPVGSARSYTATVVGYDITDDVSVVQMKGATNLTTITANPSAPVLIGQPVVGIGNAGGKGGAPTPTQGVVTAVDQTVTASDQGANAETLHGMIQTDAQIQPGDSGGPLVDAAAQVIGMDTAASTPDGRLQQASQTLGFAIPIGRALTIAHQIEAGQAGANIHLGSRALLGVEIRDTATTQTGAGAPVVGVQPNSPASSLGLTVGDSIVSLNGTTIGSFSDLTNALTPFHAGDQVTLGWVDSAGHHHTGSVTLVVGPPG
jgi:S1-C subfamily serine protease